MHTLVCLPVVQLHSQRSGPSPLGGVSPRWRLGWQWHSTPCCGARRDACSAGSPTCSFVLDMPLLLMKPPAHCTAAVLDRQHACGRVQRLPSLPQLLLLLLRRRRALLPADRLCACRGRRRAAHAPSLAAVSRLCMCPCPPADYMHTPLPEDNTTLHDLGFEALPFLDADAVSEVMVYCGGWCGCSGGCSRWVAYCAGWLPSRQARGDCFGMQTVAAASEATAGSGGPPLELSVNAEHNALSRSSGGATAEGSTAEGPAFGLRRQAPPPMPRHLKRVHARALLPPQGLPPSSSGSSPLLSRGARASMPWWFSNGCGPALDMLCSTTCGPTTAWPLERRRPSRCGPPGRCHRRCMLSLLTRKALHCHHIPPASPTHPSPSTSTANLLHPVGAGCPRELPGAADPDLFVHPAPSSRAALPCPGANLQRAMASGE